MAATIVINEYNGAGEAESANIANSNMGSTDDSELVAADNPVVPGENTFEKWQKIVVTAMGGSSKILNLKVWRTTALGGSASHLTNARESSYGGAESYAQPTASASSVATEAMPTSEPSGANLGIGGALAGELTGTGSSDYLVHQIQTDAGDVVGASCTMHYQYDEIS